MASTTETGHAKNVATFEELISFCTAYGATYNPSRSSLQLTALTTQFTTASAALQAVKTAKTNYDNATNARELLFEPLARFSTRVMGAFTASGVSKQSITDARSSHIKLQGRRSKSVDKPSATALAEGAEPVKTVSVSQQSFDKRIDHFAQLVQTVSSEPSYQPNENELKVIALTTLLADLRAKNTAVINAYAALSNARIARDQALYTETTGIIDTAQDIKQYVKSIYGTTSPQYKQVGTLRFNRSRTE